MKYLLIVIILCFLSCAMAQNPKLSFEDKFNIFLQSIESNDIGNYKLYENDVFEDLISGEYHDSIVISLISNQFISPNLYSFKNYQQSLKYIDYLKPKLVSYHGEYSIDNFVLNANQAFVFMQLGNIKSELDTRRYLNIIYEELSSEQQFEVARLYTLNLDLLEEIYHELNQDIEYVNILKTQLKIATTKHKQFDIANSLFSKWGTDTLRYSSHIDASYCVALIMESADEVKSDIVVEFGKESMQYVSFLTNIGYAYRFLDKDELFVNSLEEAFRFINPNYYKSNRDFSTYLFNICAPLSTHYLSIDNIEESLFYDMAYLEVCDDFETKILVLSGILMNVSTQPGTYDSLIKKVIHQIEMDLQSDEASYITKMDIIIGITTSFLNTEDYNMVQIWQRIKYDLMQANNATEKEMIEDYWICQAQVECNLGNVWKAKEILHRCFKAGNIISEDYYERMLNNQAINLIKLKEFEEASVLFRLIEEKIDTTQFDSDKSKRKDYLTLMDNLSNSYSLQKKYKEALYYSNISYDFANKWFGQFSNHFFTSINNRAVILTEIKGREQEGFLLSQKVLELAEEIYGKSSSSYSLALNNLFTKYFLLEHYSKADALFIDAYNYFRNDFLAKSKGLTKKELELYSSKLLKGMGLYSEYAIKRKDVHPDFYMLVINDLLRGHNLCKNRAFTIQKKSNPSLLRQYKTLKKKYFENLQLSVSEIKKQDIDFDDIEREYQKIESQLFQEVPFDFDSEISIENIQSKLSQGDAFVFNFPYSDSKRLKYDMDLDSLYIKPHEIFYDFIIITKNDIQHLHLPYLAMDYWEVFEDLQSEIQKKGILKSNTHKHFQGLIDAIKNYQHIYFCPEGLFSDINLETLFDHKTNKFLLENSRVEITSPHNFIHGNYRKEINVKGKNAVFFGNPNYDMDLNDYSSSDGKFGFSVFKNEGEERCYIYGVNNPKTPAYKSPLKDGGFLLLELNGIPIKKEWSQDDVIQMLKGREGTEAEFKITNKVIKDTLVFSIERENPKEWYKSNYSPLPFTDIEVDECSDFLTQNGYVTEIFKGEGATETELKNIDNPNILHIATHSYYEYPENMDKKSLAIHNGFYTKNYWGNPELMGGVLMAGSNDFYIEESKVGIDNGIVNTTEISQLDLSSTELVVMSSCESAKGFIWYASNLNGFMEGFQLAGARQMIATLWNVKDAKTSEFMTLFYEMYAEDQNASVALYQAKLKMFQKYDRAYWAPFVLIHL